MGNYYTRTSAGELLGIKNKWHNVWGYLGDVSRRCIGLIISWVMFPEFMVNMFSIEDQLVVKFYDLLWFVSWMRYVRLVHENSVYKVTLFGEMGISIWLSYFNWKCYLMTREVINDNRFWKMAFILKSNSGYDEH